MSINRDQANLIISEIDAALKEIALKHGLISSRNRGRFDANRLKLGVELNVPPAATCNSMPDLSRPVTQRSLGDLNFLLPGSLGKVFFHKGHSFTITGASLRRPKYPIDTLRDDSRPFHFTASLVRSLIK